MTTEVDDFESRIRVDLERECPYDAQQFAQSYLARKFPAGSGYDVFVKFALAIDIILAFGYGSDAATLFNWFQNRYMTKYSDDDIASALEGICLQLRKSKPDCAGQFASLIYSEVISFIMSRESVGNKVYLDSVAQIKSTLAEALLGAQLYQPAVSIFLRCDDIISVVETLNNWAAAGSDAEYPLYFARATVKLLCDNRRISASQLVKLSERHIDQYCRIHGKQSAALSLAVWHFSVILCDLINLATKVASIEEKAAIYRHVSRRYLGIVNKVDPDLVSSISEIERVYKLGVQQFQGILPGRGVAPLLRRGASSRL
jgi:hypothetical protein